MYLLCPLLASIIYVVGALWLKRAGEHGADTWLIAVVSNWTSAALFIGLGVALGDATGSGVWWQAAVTGACFVAGQTLAFAAFKYGDVSVATPVLGLKVILVAVFTIVMLGDYGSPAVWAGAILATIGIAALSKSDAAGARKVWQTVLLSFGGAAGYAAFDVCLQKWAPLWGVQHFLLWAFVWVAGLSCAFLPAVRKPQGGLRRGWTFLWLGAVAIALQSLLIALVIGYKGNATAVNVVYSLRGVWSVLIVWHAGHWFANSEAAVGSRILKYRISGAAAMVVGVILVFS